MKDEDVKLEEIEAAHTPYHSLLESKSVVYYKR
jgi:hypothetical protein